MTPVVGVELDAAVLRAIDWKPQETFMRDMAGNLWPLEPPPTGISTDEPNGHEALRLCGPWLDERCTLWIVYSRKTSFQCDAWINGTKLDTSELYATRAEAICRLVLAVSEREGK